MGRRRAEQSSFVADLQERARDAPEEFQPPTVTEVESRLIPSSAKAYRSILRLWSEFSTQVLCEARDPEIPFPHMPSVGHIKLFLQWLVRGSNGLIDQKITDVTVKNYLAALKRAVKNHTGHQYNHMQNSEIAAHIRIDLPKLEGLSTGAYKKPIAPLEVTRDLVRFALVCDEYEYPHPRILTQTILMMLLLTFGGARPGEIVESYGWKDSNEGLLYGDIEVVKQSNDNYQGLAITIHLRNRKGQRSNDKSSPGFYYTLELDTTLCPVTWFLGHALTDGVFESARSFHEMEAKEIPPGATQYRFKYKAGMANRPIMRSVTPSGAISDTKIWTYNCFSQQLRSLGQRAGYRDTLSSYCFRRGYANAIEGAVDNLRKKQMMGHSNDRIRLRYLSSVVQVDPQSIVLGRTQRMELVRSHVSMMAERNLLAPKPPGAQLTDKPKRDSSVPTDVNPGKQPSTVAFANLTPTQQYELRRQSRKSRFSKVREDFFADGVEHTRLGSDDTDCLLRFPSRYLRALMKHEPDRQRLATLLYPDVTQLDDEGTGDERAPPSAEGEKILLGLTPDAILPSLIRMASPEKSRYAYRGAEPTHDSYCPVCKDQLQTNRPERMNHHLLKCSRKRRVQRAREHMDRVFSGLAMCLWNDCSYRFGAKAYRPNTLHVTEHITATRSLQCLWNGCYQVLENHDTLAYHISQAHGVPNRYTTQTTMQYCYEHDIWCASERMWIAHLQKRHLEPLNDFCGLIRRNGVVVVAAYCVFCLGNSSESLQTRFTQFPDIFALHEHMKKHKTELNAFPAGCPHPLCTDSLHSATEFWEHATAVHGVPPFGRQRLDLKRKQPSHDDVETLPDCVQGSALTVGG